MTNATVIQMILGAVLGSFMGYILWTFKRNSKHTDDKIDLLFTKVDSLSEMVHTVKDNLIDRVNNNKGEVAELKSEVCALQEKVEGQGKTIDKLEKILDRRLMGGADV